MDEWHGIDVMRMVYEDSVCRVEDSRCDVVVRCGKRRYDISLFAGAVPGLISRIRLEY